MFLFLTKLILFSNFGGFFIMSVFLIFGNFFFFFFAFFMFLPFFVEILAFLPNIVDSDFNSGDKISSLPFSRVGKNNFVFKFSSVGQNLFSWFFFSHFVYDKIQKKKIFCSFTASKILLLKMFKVHTGKHIVNQLFCKDLYFKLTNNLKHAFESYSN